MKYLLLLLLSFPAQAFYDPDIHFYYPDAFEQDSPVETFKYCSKPFGEGKPVLVAAPPQNGMWKRMDSLADESECVKEFAKWEI